MIETKICVVFSDTLEGRTALSFAANLHRLIGGDQLQVYLATDSPSAFLVTTHAGRADEMQKTRVLNLVAESTALPKGEILVREFQSGDDIDIPEGAILVDHALPDLRTDIHVLTPFDEKTLDQRGEGPFLIPFGDGDSGKTAGLLGLKLAARLARKVVFYHTTWRSASTSTNPFDHMCDAARADLEMLEGWARDFGVEHETIIQMAPDVTEGILRAATDVSASLIVIARGKKTKIGSYVSQMLEQSPFPLLDASAHQPQELPLVSGRKKVTVAKAAPEEPVRPGGIKGVLVRAEEILLNGVDRAVRLLPESIQKRVGNPIFVMVVVGLMYIIKAAVKTGIGMTINSPMLTGDGLHNLADLFEAAAVIAVILVSQRPPSERYAYGRKNIEFFTAGAIGIGLIGMSVMFLVKSMVGILSYFPVANETLRSIIWLPEHEALVMSGTHFPWVVAITAGSVILSFLVSRYQVTIGRKTGHDSLVADGEETMSDGRIEFVALVGVLAEYAFHSPWIEYPLGVLIAYLIARTGKELWLKAWHVLLQHTIGVEHDQKIREICLSTRGVLEATEVKTFQVGRIAVIHLQVTTLRTANTVVHIKYAIEKAVEKYVLAQDFTRCETHINFQGPSPSRHRKGIAITRNNGNVAIAANLESATSVVVCDVECGRIIRATEEPVTGDPLELLALKRVNVLFQFEDTTNLGARLAENAIEVNAAPSYLPEAAGLPRRVMEA